MSAKPSNDALPSPAKVKKNARVFVPSERAEEETTGELEPPSFPSECLPPVLRSMADGVATLERLPVAMTGPMVLAMASAALGRGVKLKSLGGKLTPANLYVCVCKESGTGGSTAFRHITAPMDGMQARILREFRKDTLPSLEADKKLLMIEASAAESAIKAALKNNDLNGKNEAHEKLKGLHVRLKIIEDNMREPLLWTGDSTPEALAEKLAANDCTLAQMNPDAGDSFSSMLGCYRDKSSRDGSHALWLKCYSNESHTITRTRGTIALESTWLAMLLVVTPNTARRHLEDSSLLETGFLGRMLLCDPRAKMSVGTFEEELANPSLPSLISQQYEAAIWKALALYRRPRGLCWSEALENCEEGEFKPFVIECNEDALRVIHEDRKRQTEQWHAAENDREMTARQTEQALRIALVLHVFQWMTFNKTSEGTWKVKSCTGHEHQLSAETIRHAIAIRNYFNTSLASMMVNQKAAAKDEAWAKLQLLASRYGWEKQGITPRNILTHKLGGIHNAQGATNLLDQWATEGKLIKRDREAKATGRNPSPPSTCHKARDTSEPLHQGSVELLQIATLQKDSLSQGG